MLSNTLKHYKRIEVQKAIIDAAQDKEAVGSYGGKGYAKRPDVLVYPADVFELVKQGITSFHLSEETWSNPLNIVTGMKPGELNQLRKGWDLVLDIDCPYWEFAKIVTWLFVRALEDHSISSISVKFSGNKGFHIGVPFEAFPETVEGIPTSEIFPDGPRKIAQFLLEHISKNLITVQDNKISFGSYTYDFNQIQSITKKTADELLQTFCHSCGQTKKKESDKQYHFTCPVCGSAYTTKEDLEYRKCMKCNILMEKSSHDLSGKCCPDPNFIQTFNPLSIVEVDTVLIASRHLYRAPYSYHEKSGLVSVPIPKERIMSFEKDMAKIENAKFDTLWLPRDTQKDEASRLLLAAIEHHARLEQKKQEQEASQQYKKDFNKEFEEVQEAIPEQFFPPCINLIMNGLPDGKKRALFVLINFLMSVGWSYEEIEERLKKWNDSNPEPVREVYMLGQLRYAKQRGDKKMPPNCDNKGYYKDFHVCHPDGLCRFIKNPVNYTIKKARMAQKEAMKQNRKMGKPKQELQKPKKEKLKTVPEPSKTKNSDE